MRASKGWSKNHQECTGACELLLDRTMVTTSILLAGLPEGEPKSSDEHALKRCAVDRPDHRPMMPRFTPIMAACVRSFARSFESIFFTRLFTVSSLIQSCAAIS